MQLWHYNLNLILKWTLNDIKCAHITARTVTNITFTMFDQWMYLYLYLRAVFCSLIVVGRCALVIVKLTVILAKKKCIVLYVGLCLWLYSSPVYWQHWSPTQKTKQCLKNDPTVAAKIIKAHIHTCIMHQIADATGATVAYNFSLNSPFDKFLASLSHSVSFARCQVCLRGHEEHTLGYFHVLPVIVNSTLELKLPIAP